MQSTANKIDPSVKRMLLLGILMWFGGSAAYLLNFDFIESLNFKLTDAIVAATAKAGISDGIVVVTIDEAALEKWGQWPWPRKLVARLLAKIADKGAGCIALDFIMAESDRTTTHPSAPFSDNDADLAQTLSAIPAVLGYEFTFFHDRQNHADCLLHPFKTIGIDPSTSGTAALKLYRAPGVICNLPRLSRAASRSGFINGRPDTDGRLRRLPLLIEYNQAVYPSLVLAAWTNVTNNPSVRLERHVDGQGWLVVGGNRIPVDENGNLIIRYTTSESNLQHISAADILAGRLAGGDLENRIVLVGITASGLAPAYQTPADGWFSAVEIHAQAVETILMETFVRRHQGMRYYEILLSLIAVLAFALSIARLEFMTTSIIGLTGIIGMWGGALALFANRQILISPLLPTALMLLSGLLLMLFKYWTRQRGALHRMSEALVLMKNSENNLDAIIKTIPDIVFRLGPTGRITFISTAVAKYRTQPEELVGKHILELVAPKDKKRAAWRINERRTGERATHDLEVKLVFPAIDGDGSDRERWFSISAEGIYNEAPPKKSSFTGTQGIARDIDQRKQLERKLEQSKKMEAMGSLAAGVAHDLNNILSGLVSYPELLLLDLPPDSPMRSQIETIQRSGHRAAEIVQDLLMIARRGVKNHETININDAVKAYLKTPEYKRLTESRPDLRLTTELAEDLMNITGSLAHILKVIVNLAGNAIEAMPTGGSACIHTVNRYLDTSIGRYEQIPEGEYVVLTVADEGIGIPEEDFTRIFEPFYSKKRMGSSGSGLGMTVVWNTVKDHGGFVDIESREGQGTRFDIYLPASREVDLGSERRIVLQDYIGSERILVVDDIAEQRDIAVRMLSKLGYKVASASGGEQAVAYLQTHTADLLVLDMVMPPGIDGLETYRRILEEHPGQKAIIASGYAPSDRVEAMQAMGAGEYIRKPYTMEKIGMAVRRALNLRKSDDQRDSKASSR